MDTCTRYVDFGHRRTCGAVAKKWLIRRHRESDHVIPRCEAHSNEYPSSRFEELTRDEAEVLTVLGS